MNGYMRLESDIPVYEMVCDLCLVPNSVRWTYITDNNCTTEEWEAHRHDPNHRAGDGNPMFHQRDPRWAVCQACHELIQANNRKVLYGRMMEGHRNRKRTHLAEMLASSRARDPERRGEIEDAIRRFEAMEAARKASPALGMSFDLSLAVDIEAVLRGFMTYRHSEAIPEPYTSVDRVLATRWQRYTSHGALPVMPMAGVPADAPDDAIFEVAISDMPGQITVLADGEYGSQGQRNFRLTPEG